MTIKRHYQWSSDTMIDHGNQCEDTVILLEVLLHAYDEYEHVFIAKSNMATVAREKQYT